MGWGVGLLFLWGDLLLLLGDLLLLLLESLRLLSFLGGDLDLEEPLELDLEEAEDELLDASIM